MANRRRVPGGGNIQCKGLLEGVSVPSMPKEKARRWEARAGGSLGSRAVGQVGKVMGDWVMGNLTGHGKDIGSHSERHGSPLGVWSRGVAGPDSHF